MIFSYIRCLNILAYSGYQINYNPLFDFVLFDSQRKKYPPILLESLRVLPTFIHGNRRLEDVAKVDQRLQIFYDITRLVSHNTHSGISRVTWKVYQLLNEISFIDVIPVFNRAYLQTRDKTKDTLRVNYVGGDEVDAQEYHHAMTHSTSSPSIYHSGYYPIPPDIPSGIKKVITLYDIIHLTNKKHYPDSSKFVTGDIARSCLWADVVLSISEFSGKELRTYLDEDLKIVPMPLGSMIDKHFPPNGFSKYFRKNQRVLTFAYQGGDPRKNFQRMLKVGKDWLGIDSENAVCIFGDINKLQLQYADSDMIRSSRARLVLSPSDSDLSRIYQESSIYLYLSEAEGFGLPPLEAMSLGCPAVMLSNSSLAEIFRGWPGLIDNGATDDIVLRTISQLVDDPTSRDLAARFSSRFSWDLSVCMAIVGYLISISSPEATDIRKFQATGVI